MINYLFYLKRCLRNEIINLGDILLNLQKSRSLYPSTVDDLINQFNPNPAVFE